MLIPCLTLKKVNFVSQIYMLNIVSFVSIRGDQRLGVLELRMFALCGLMYWKKPEYPD